MDYSEIEQRIPECKDINEIIDAIADFFVKNGFSPGEEVGAKMSQLAFDQLVRLHPTWSNKELAQQSLIICESTFERARALKNLPPS